MVEVLVGDKDVVGLAKPAVVGRWLHALAHGIDLKLKTIVVDLERAVLDGSDHNLLARWCGKGIGYGGSSRRSLSAGPALSTAAAARGIAACYHASCQQ